RRAGSKVKQAIYTRYITYHWRHKENIPFQFPLEGPAVVAFVIVYIKVPQQAGERVCHYALYIIGAPTLVYRVYSIYILQVCGKYARITVEAYKLQHLWVKSQYVFCCGIGECIIDKVIIVRICTTQPTYVLPLLVYTPYFRSLAPVEYVCIAYYKRVRKSPVAVYAFYFPQSHRVYGTVGFIQEWQHAFFVTVGQQAYAGYQ